MAITGICRDQAENVNMVRIASTDSLGTMGGAGYLTAQADVISELNNGEFQFLESDIICAYSTEGAHAFFEFHGDDFTTMYLTLQSGPLFTSVAITAAQFNGMYAAPKLLIAAPGSGNLIVIDQAFLIMTYGTAAFAAGGVVKFQYDSTANGAGVAATNSEAAADFFATASTTYQFIGTSGNTVGASPFSTTANKGIYLSNLTGAFTTGDSTFIAKIYYNVLSVA